ncbi:MAG: hypothetical protein D4S01_05090 [Dehalococcoidia bacterium]|nr:MAG: hypothetical protein D4S01_05090 [Dehalococcoidia bacterium]
MILAPTTVPPEILQLNLISRKQRRAYLKYLIDTCQHQKNTKDYYAAKLNIPNVICPMSFHQMEKEKSRLLTSLWPAVIESAGKVSWWHWYKKDGFTQRLSNSLPAKMIPVCNRYLARFNPKENPDKEYLIWRQGFNTAQNFWLVDTETLTRYEICRGSSIPETLQALHGPFEKLPLLINERSTINQEHTMRARIVQDRLAGITKNLYSYRSRKVA